jgi:NADH-quinone oxidoreductase subunit H
VPAFLAVLSVVVRAGSIRLSDVVSSQSSGVLNWGVFADPSQPVAFVVFLLGSVMMSGFAPMDAAFLMGDLSGGVASFATGRHQYLLRIARFYAMFFWAAFGVALFLGGWNLPGTVAAGLAGAEAFGLLAAAEVFVTLLKTFGLLIGMILISRVVPRPRVDLVSSISWKILTPLSLAVLMFGAIWKGMSLG